MFTLKPLSVDAIAGAQAKAERYRLLSEPWQAESICRDILAVDPGNRDARVTMVLALTDQFERGIGAREAQEAVSRLSDPYDRAYYTGIVHERRAFALFRQSDFRSGDAVYMLLSHAMEWYEKAEAIRAPGNDDSLLRWNTCARFLDRYQHLKPTEREQQLEPVLSD